MHWRKLALKATGFCWLGLIIAANPCSGDNINDYRAAKQIRAQSTTMKERIIEERDREIEAHTNSVQDKIQVVNESAEIEIANKVPRYFYNGWGYPVPNPDYERAVAYIRVDAQKQINAINKDLAAMTKTINAAYEEKLKAIDSSMANVDSQIQPGTSDVQLTPMGSNLYVKNYVNYAAEKTERGPNTIRSSADFPAKRHAVSGLKAREKSLAYKTSRRIKQTDLKQ